MAYPVDVAPVLECSTILVGVDSQTKGPGCSSDIHQRVLLYRWDNSLRTERNVIFEFCHSFADFLIDPKPSSLPPNAVTPPSPPSFPSPTHSLTPPLSCSYHLHVLVAVGVSLVGVIIISGDVVSQPHHAPFIISTEEMMRGYLMTRRICCTSSSDFSCYDGFFQRGFA